MNTNDYFYYLHKTPEADYTKFFEIGLIDYDKTFRIESTMEKVDENTLLHGGLEEVMKTFREGDANIFLIKIPKSYFPDRQHRDGSWDVPIPVFYERKLKDKYGREGMYPVLIPNLVQGCYNKDKGFITNPDFCPVFDPSGLKFGYEQLQPMRNDGYFRYDDYMKRNNADIRELYNYDKVNNTWEPFVEYYARKFNAEPVTLFDDESDEKTQKSV